MLLGFRFVEGIRDKIVIRCSVSEFDGSWERLQNRWQVDGTNSREVTDQKGAYAAKLQNLAASMDGVDEKVWQSNWQLIVPVRVGAEGCRCRKVFEDFGLNAGI
jgi:hypothetical protein